MFCKTGDKGWFRLFNYIAGASTGQAAAKYLSYADVKWQLRVHQPNEPDDPD